MYRRIDIAFDQPVGLDQFQQDLRRLFELEHKRQSKIGLTEEEVAEEAHRIARIDTLIYGGEGEASSRLADLERQARFAARNRQHLQPGTTKDPAAPTGPLWDASHLRRGSGTDARLSAPRCEARQ